MQHNWKPLIALGCLLAAFSWPMMGLNPNYDFTIVAISGQTIDGLQLTPAFGGQPCINDSGEIVFTGSYMISPGNFGSALFTPNHVIVKAGDQIDGQVLINVGLCSLNNYGELLFIGGEQSGQSALFEKQGPSPAELVVASPQKIGGLELHQFLSFSVNDAGKIVFSAFYTGQNGFRFCDLHAGCRPLAARQRGGPSCANLRRSHVRAEFYRTVLSCAHHWRIRRYLHAYQRNRQSW